MEVQEVQPAHRLLPHFLKFDGEDPLRQLRPIPLIMPKTTQNHTAILL